MHTKVGVCFDSFYYFDVVPESLSQKKKKTQKKNNKKKNNNKKQNKKHLNHQTIQCMTAIKNFIFTIGRVSPHSGGKTPFWEGPDCLSGGARQSLSHDLCRFYFFFTS